MPGFAPRAVASLAAAGLATAVHAQTTGRCCTGSACTVVTQPACAAAAGQWSAGVGCQAGGAVLASMNSVAVSIPDGNEVGISSTVTVAESFAVSGVSVEVVVNHTWIADLTIDLTHAGNTVRLWDQSCSSRSGMNLTFADAGGAVICASPTTGVVRPAAPLSGFLGAASAGAWTLTVVDHDARDAGNLVSWSLRVARPGPSACALAACRSDFTGDGASDIRDVFAYLALWFGGAPVADQNADALVDVRDLFGFLSAWFAGCP